MPSAIVADAPRRSHARVAAVFYIITFVTGIAALQLKAGFAWYTMNVISDVAYLVVTALFYQLFKPVNRNLSLAAALFSLLGIASGFAALVRLPRLPVNSLVFFGCYCLLIGYLVFRSTFLPRVLGAFMCVAGLGWLTFLSPSLARSLQPYNMAPGVIGEGLLMLWLVIAGVDAVRWNSMNDRLTREIA